MPKRSAAADGCGRRRGGRGRRARRSTRGCPSPTGGRTARAWPTRRRSGAAPPRRRSTGSRPKVRTVPASGVEGAGDHPDGGGLAGAVGAEQHGDRALRARRGQVASRAGTLPNQRSTPRRSTVRVDVVGDVGAAQIEAIGDGASPQSYIGTIGPARSEAVSVRRRRSAGSLDGAPAPALASYGCSCSASIPACRAAATACSTRPPAPIPARARAVALGVIRTPPAAAVPLRLAELQTRAAGAARRVPARRWWPSSGCCSR